MDEIDRQLIALLSDNSRASIKELSRSVELSRTAVSDRIRKLEQSGEIAAYTIRRRSKGEPHLFLIKTSVPSCEQLAPRFAAMSEVKQMRSLAGDIDILVEILVEDQSRLHQIRELIAGWDEVTSVQTVPVLKTHLQR